MGEGIVVKPKNNHIKLSVVIISGNEESMIIDCIKSAKFADEIILVTTPSNTDNTQKIAQNTYPKLISDHISTPGIDFSAWRNHGAKLANGQWILFLDADERITSNLKKEILSITNSSNLNFTNYDIPRANYFLGKRVRFGNTYPDYVKRLFLKSKFIGFKGKLHEQPQISGPSSVIKSDLLHYTHRDLTSMLEKTIKWTKLEADLLFKANHPPVVWWRFPRMMLTKFFERLIKQQMFRDGTVGWISVIFEVFNTFIIYARLWEMQQNEKSRYL